jgi:hypothetical protein
VEPVDPDPGSDQEHCLKETTLPKKRVHLEDLMLLGDECQVSVLSS